MEVFQTERYYIFVKKEKSLWWNRSTSEFIVKCGWDLSSVGDIECIGLVYGIVGVVSLPGVYDPHLIVIKESIPIGVLYPPNLVYRIKSIGILSNDEPDTMLLPCPRHTTSTSARINNSPPTKTRLFESSLLVNKTWGAMKSAGSTIKSTTQQAAAIASNQVKSTVGIKDPTRIEKKITEELHKIFDDTDSFYYCNEGDLTNNIQRSYHGSVDDRFFWNKYLLKDIIGLNDNHWVLPIIQGFVQVEQCVIANECFTLSLVSRRSRHRAGTRYKRRGVDEEGNCANYVETEQILSFRQHQMSFTQIRGSVPVYWSQPGYKYRPPPRLDRDENETQIAFEKHFNNELELYKSVCIVNLVEQTGKEKVIGDAYANHIIKYNNDKLIYVSFDFHDYCRGMRFENVSALVEALAPELGAMGFQWKDSNGSICNQKSIFRVNCMDCLDRTNVVQTALGKAILESQLVKLGLAPPYSPIPEPMKIPFMLLWANNGDVISRQYAGTNALKGDYTRTGERKISGIMKDGMNSANRYFIQHFADTFRQSIINLLHGNIENVNDINEDDTIDTIINVAQTIIPTTNLPKDFVYTGVLGPELHLAENLFNFASYYLARFKDTYRQATIDLMSGNQVSTESLNSLGGQFVDENDALEGAEHARLLVEDCRRLLLGTVQYPIGSWGLIDADPSTGDPTETEVDSILLLTDDCYLVAEYDSHLDKITRFEKVSLTNITMIELGMFQQTSKMFQGSAPTYLCIRLNYTVDGVDGYFHMFRSANIRFFNNVAVIIKTQEEISESMTAIVEFFRIALENRGKHDVQVLCGGTLQRRKSKTPLLDIPKGIPRNLSESQLLQIGTKALSNVAGQFSKLGQSLNPTKNRNNKNNRNNSNPHVVYNPSTNYLEKNASDGKATFTVGKENKDKDYSSESDDNDCSIYEPDNNDLVQENPLYNENSFLPSVGIVMSSGNASSDQPQLLENKDNMAKNSSDVCTMSISSVTDNVVMPAGMLDGCSPIHGRCPTPEIRIEPTSSGATGVSFIGGGISSSAASLALTGDGQQKLSQSSNEVRIPSATRSISERDLTLNLTGSQSENALKQLKTLTSPLSKLAKGMQNFGMNLDPRKIASKTGIVPRPVETFPSPVESQKLQELWDETKCRTKLIAL